MEAQGCDPRRAEVSNLGAGHQHHYNPLLHNRSVIKTLPEHQDEGPARIYEDLCGSLWIYEENKATEL